MAFCEKCGAMIADDIKFCDKCGAPTNYFKPASETKMVSIILSKRFPDQMIFFHQKFST